MIWSHRGEDAVVELSGGSNTFMIAKITASRRLDRGYMTRPPLGATEVPPWRAYKRTERQQNTQKRRRDMELPLRMAQHD